MLEGEIFLTPLSAVAHRMLNIMETASTQEILEYFLRRGEDVNEQCNPDGTMLHALIAHFFEHCDCDYSGLDQALRLLLYTYGADFNGTGSHGTPLDMLFEMYMQVRDQFQDHDDTSRNPMELHESFQCLLHFGAVPQHADANGHVLSIDEMKSIIVVDYAKYNKEFEAHPDTALIDRVIEDMLQKEDEVIGEEDVFLE